MTKLQGYSVLAEIIQAELTGSAWGVTRDTIAANIAETTVLAVLVAPEFWGAWGQALMDDPDTGPKLRAMLDTMTPAIREAGSLSELEATRVIQKLNEGQGIRSWLTRRG